LRAEEGNSRRLDRNRGVHFVRKMGQLAGNHFIALENPPVLSKT